MEISYNFLLCTIREFGERNVCRNGCDKNTKRTGARTLFLLVAVAVSCCLANPVGNYNGCCERVWLWREFKMAADIDVYLFALMEGDIDDEEYLLLIEEFDNASMKQSRFLYEEYDPFDWNALDELVCKTEFRFEKNDVPRLLHVLQIPAVISIERCNVCPSIEALCILLKRFAYPVRYCDMVPLFGRSVPELCRIVHCMVNLIYENYHFRLTSWNQPFLSRENLQLYATFIHNKGAPLSNCFGFIDGTVRPMCRPEKNQRHVYNGHKRVHCLKFQNICLPNGLIANLSGPWGRYIQ